MIGLIIIWLAFIVVHAFYDKRNFGKKKESPVYIASFLVRGGIAIVHAALFDILEIRPMPDTMYWKPLVIWWAPILIWQVSSFYLFFDPFLNYIRHLKVSYRGKTSGWLDKMNDTEYLILKAFCLIALVWTSIILL